MENEKSRLQRKVLVGRRQTKSLELCHASLNFAHPGFFWKSKLSLERFGEIESEKDFEKGKVKSQDGEKFWWGGDKQNPWNSISLSLSAHSLFWRSKLFL